MEVKQVVIDNFLIMKDAARGLSTEIQDSTRYIPTCGEELRSIIATYEYTAYNTNITLTVQWAALSPKLSSARQHLDGLNEIDN